MALPLRQSDDLARCALADLADDIDELQYLAGSQLRRLRAARLQTRRMRHAFQARTLRTELAQLLSAENTFRSYEQALGTCLYEITRGTACVDGLRAIKNEYADLLRLQQGISAALIAGSDWQSPVFDGAGYPTAGRHSGVVVEHVDDYKRDRHPSARTFEERYLREYVAAPDGLELQARMTACGMAAFTTILHFLCSAIDQARPVVATRGMYHECRGLLADSPLGVRVHWVDDGDTAEIRRACRQLQPAALFLDSMCNSKELAVPDTTRVLLDLADSKRRDIYVVVDNTCAPIFSHPFRVSAWSKHLRVLMFESLTKYAQFGFDRVAAGMIVAPIPEADELDRLREHLGTNVSDVSVAAVPEPNRALLGRRLRRIERNAGLLAQHIAEYAETPGMPVRVVYPGLSSHPCHGAARRLGFYGGFFALRVGLKDPSPADQARLVSRLIRSARRRNVSLVAGASFGFNVTRAYRTATEIGLGPFVRISAGTEDLLEVERLKEVFSGVTPELSAVNC